MTTAADADFDAELVRRARAGEHGAFAALVQRHDVGLRRLTWHVVRDRDLMDDVLQQVYLKAYLGLRGFREGSSVRAWLSKIAWNAAIDELRRASRRELPSEEAGAKVIELRPDPAKSVADRLALDEALERLPVEQRAAVVLVDAEGYDYREAAQVLGVAPGTVASRLSRARATLRGTLREAGR